MPRAPSTGTSLAPAGLTLSPGSHTYDDTTAGSSDSFTFTVTNAGDVATPSAPAPTLTGPASSIYAIGANTCAGGPLAGGDSCTIEVTFNPVAPITYNATLNVNAGGGLSDTSSLTGDGLAAAVLGITPTTTQSCPANYAGNDTYTCATFTVQNGGGSDADVSAAVTGDFEVDPSSSCVTSPTLTASGGMCDVTILHAPTGIGADSGTLTVSSPGISSVTGDITSSGTAALERTSGSSCLRQHLGDGGWRRDHVPPSPTRPTRRRAFW